MCREGTKPCERKETWKDNVFKAVFRSGKEKREIQVEDVKQKQATLIMPLHFYYHLRKIYFVSQRNIDPVQAPGELWLSVIIKKETEWTII